MLDIPPFIARLLHMRREQEKHDHAEWQNIEAENEQRKLVIREIRALMKETYQKYTRATRHLHGLELETFQHYQSPRNILAVDPRFPHLAELLREQKTWDMLTRGERRFIAAVCKVANIPA